MTFLGTITYALFRKVPIRVVFVITILLAFLIRFTPELLITGVYEYLYIPAPLFAISDS
jgi:hypothetical protein